MKIYKISHKLKYQQLIPVEEDFFRKHQFNGKEFGDRWDKPTFYLNDPLLKRGDFFHISPSVLCFTRKVFYSELGSELGKVGEILEINIEREDEPVYILNSLIRYNCLNHSELKYQNPFTKVFPLITEFSFHPNRIGDSTIFKLPDSPEVPLLCISSSDRECFHDLYKSSNFSGLEFKEIWTNE